MTTYIDVNFHIQRRTNTDHIQISLSLIYSNRTRLLFAENNNNDYNSGESSPVCCI